MYKALCIQCEKLSLQLLSDDRGFRVQGYMEHSLHVSVTGLKSRMLHSRISTPPPGPNSRKKKVKILFLKNL